MNERMERKKKGRYVNGAFIGGRRKIIAHKLIKIAQREQAGVRKRDQKY